MPGGRPPKPTRAKAIAGTLRADRMNADEPMPQRGRPVCPSWLDDIAKRRWAKIVPELDRLGMLTLVDGDALACYCQAFAEFEIATKTIQKDGRTIATGLGGLKSHPCIDQQRTAWQAIRQFAALYGLDPSSRTRLKVPVKTEDDPMAAFLEGRA